MGFILVGLIAVTAWGILSSLWGILVGIVGLLCCIGLRIRANRYIREGEQLEADTIAVYERYYGRFPER
jgi:protein-S-isoprenylcysteine O-methyltransferase Ste14